MILWTAQTIEAYNTLIHTGVYRCDTSKITDFEWWKPAYDWMVKEMLIQIRLFPIMLMVYFTIG